MGEFAFRKRSLLIAERTSPIVPAFDGYMRHFLAAQHVSSPEYFEKYKNELQKLQAELQFTLIAEVITNITADPLSSAVRIERWVAVMQEAFENKNFRKVLIILNALNSDEVKRCTQDYKHVTFNYLLMMEEIAAALRVHKVTFNNAEFVHVAEEDAQSNYFDYHRFTSGDEAMDQDKFDAHVRKKAEKLEPHSKISSSPIFVDYYKDLFFSQTTRVRLNAQVRNRLKQDALNNEIMGINAGKVYDNLHWLEEYSKKGLNVFSWKRKKKISAILVQLQEVKRHVTESAHKGLVPNLKTHLHTLKLALQDPLINPPQYEEDEVVLKLKKLRAALLKTKKIAKQHVALIRAYNAKRGTQLNDCVDLMASLAAMGASTKTDAKSDAQSSERSSLDLSTVVFSISSNSCVTQSAPPQVLEDSQVEGFSPAGQALTVNSQPPKTGQLVSFFEKKTRRNSILVLQEVVKEQRQPFFEEVKSFTPGFSIFKDKPTHTAVPGESVSRQTLKRFHS